MDPIRERPHRLPDSHYIGKKVVAFTVCTADRKPGLHDPAIAPILIDHLTRSLRDHRCHCAIYCIMPDHMHALIVGDAADSDTKRAFVSFKLRSGRWLRQNTPLAWQKNYWDHIVRYLEGWDKQAKYIARNPIRKGLANEIKDWPWTGSIGCDISEILESAFD